MKLLSILSAATVTCALVIPEEQVLADIQIEDHRQYLPSESKAFWGSLKDNVETVVDQSKNALDDALATLQDVHEDVSGTIYDTGYAVRSYMRNSIEEFSRTSFKPHHHHKPNHTVYELIAHSKYTTKLAALINEDEDLVKLLNGTAANYTVFAPTDRAFEKVPHGHKPSKEFLKSLLLYHISPDFYPASRVLVTHTIPTLLNSSSLGATPLPQRLAVNLGLTGLTLNLYARVVAVNIFGTNGVIHGLENIILPPPTLVDEIELLPSVFSTLALGLTKTGLLEKLNTTDHAGGTFFAPSNLAFIKLGVKANAFLFSKYGTKYLAALLKYHVVPDRTLYSDAYYGKESSPDAETQSWHVDLPTLLKDRSLSVDVRRIGPFTEIKINGFANAVGQNLIAEDGVIHSLSNVLIPPRNLGGEKDYWNGEELSVEELKERLEPFTGHQEM